ncbi:MAG: tetraacyldisaccharide 4'-kinase, partial [Roseiarcus sp.]
MIAPRFWARERPGLAARALQPLGALYGLATARRMARPGVQVEAAVVCVGNFVVGGAGKTPTAIAVARMLQGAGERVAFLSRGYGGAARAEPIEVDAAIQGAHAVGDEPLLLARIAPCFVGADRVAAARLAIARGASALVLDDGLQNPSLVKDFTFAVIDGEARFG